MRIALFGATGGTGRHLVTHGLRAGHTLVALVRDPARLRTTDDRLQVVQGDVRDGAAVDRAVAGCDAVVVALAPRSGDAAADHTAFYATATDNVVAAMTAHGVSRIAVVSAAPVAPVDPADTLPYRLVVRPLLRRVLRDHYRGLEVMEQRLHDSGLRYTLLRPPKLTTRPPSGRYRVAFDGTLRRGYLLARADLAAATIALLDDPRAERAAVAIAN